MSSSERHHGETQARIPRIKVLAVGGTIAGKGSDSGRTTQYDAGVIGIDSLLAEVPQIKELADIGWKQVANMPSFAATDGLWLELAEQVNTELEGGGCDGIVITHGTDTLEETAYFLNLTVKSDKPVVVTGAMRPATAISADGPLNLYNAVALAASEAAAGQGVMIMLNDKIGSARDMSKLNTTAADAFGAPDFGMLGYMVDGKPRFYYKSMRAHTKDSGFLTSGLRELPRVDILYGHGSGSRELVDAAAAAGAKGIVHAGMGNGGMFPAVREALADAVKRGIVVVSASRTGSGLVTAKPADLQEGFVTADTLNPQKARILLMLALTQTADTARVQRLFDTY
ncbi:asparaginase [Paenibacillus sp. MBLB4367]|uniref:asparaginase n=1 Tax=Paenibacillus sp. MBLB4367 TaxID=3384767 RepID=UPI003908419D